MAKETFIEYWDKYKRQYKYGHDYIDIDCGRHIAIVPTNFELINGILFMSHCYSSRLVPFCTFTNAYYFNPKKKAERGIKVFVLEKNVTIEELNSIDRSITNYAYPYVEFTFWLTQDGSNHLYGLHNHRNVLITSYQKEDKSFNCVHDCKEEYEYFHNAMKRYVSNIKNEFNNHKKDLLRTAFNNICDKIEYVEHSFTPKTIDMYKMGFDYYWKYTYGTV